MFRVFPSFALTLLVMGCVLYVPPVQDVFDEIYYVDELQPGVTTRQEVLDALGSPVAEIEAVQPWVVVPAVQ